MHSSYLKSHLVWLISIFSKKEHCSLSLLLWVHVVITEGDSDESFNNPEFVSSHLKLYKWRVRGWWGDYALGWIFQKWGELTLKAVKNVSLWSKRKLIQTTHILWKQILADIYWTDEGYSLSQKQTCISKYISHSNWRIKCSFGVLLSYFLTPCLQSPGSKSTMLLELQQRLQCSMCLVSVYIGCVYWVQVTHVLAALRAQHITTVLHVNGRSIKIC